MGAVYLGHDTLLERSVAIKFVLGAHDLAQAMFLNEARAAARLQHPNVVSIYRIGQVDEQHYIVSEYVRGETLDRLARPISSQRAVFIATALCRGLAAAHRRGILHRDIKLANAIQSADGEIKLLDFGIAKLSTDAASPSPSPVPPEALRDPDFSMSELAATSDISDGTPAHSRALPDTPSPVVSIRPISSSATPALQRALTSAEGLTEASSIKGTPAYMAPEVLRGELASTQSDVYSLGVLLYALCGKDPPFSRVPLAVLVKLASEVDAPPLRSVAVDVDPKFAQIVDRCLRRNPDERYRSAEELLQALVELEEGGSSELVPEGNPYRGLLPFEAAHRSLFFGRQAEIGTLLERLRTEPSVLVVADSGIGKSSLVRAGLLPPICAGVLDPTRSWRQATLVPGRHPISLMLSAVSELLGVAVEELHRLLDGNPRGLGREIALRLGEKVGAVLFIDQMEELATLSVPQEAAWIAESIASLQGQVSGFRLLMTARADYLSRLGALPGLGEDINRAFYLLRPLVGDRLREVITGPAKRKGVSFDSPELISELVESTSRTEAGLPLLQFTLSELWEARVGNIISRTALTDIGGVEGALARHADLVLSHLPHALRSTARRILIALVTVEGTRARRSSEDFVRMGEAAATVLRALVAGRLLVARQTADGVFYEVAHEALIRGWGTLQRWLDEERESRAVRQRLEAAAAEWLRLTRHRDSLWGPKQLAEATVLESVDIGPREAQFLEASRRALQSRKQLRRVLALLVPVLAGFLYLGYQAKQNHDLRMRVGAHVEEAERLLTQARARVAAVAAQKAKALALYDNRQREAGDLLWPEVLDKVAETDESYSRVGQELEAALTLDGTRQDVRRQFAKVLLEHALFIEPENNPSKMRDLLARMTLYDTTGEHRRTWEQPGRITLTTNPAGASVTIAPYQKTKSRQLHLGAATALGSTPIASISQPTGSLLLTITKNGFTPVRYPILLKRGENMIINIDLLREDQVPSTFVYIPAGRFLFGSQGDEGLRTGLLSTTPLHEVRIGSYLISKYEVTFGDWIEHLRRLPPSEREPQMIHDKDVGGLVDLVELPDKRWKVSIKPGDRVFTATSDEPLVYQGRKVRESQNWLRMPVTGITRLMGERFAAWLDQTGRVPGARVCDEYEWERAGRGADAREFPHADILLPSDANFDETHGKEPNLVGPDEVGSHLASTSPFGVMDMTGNIMEWSISKIDNYQALLRGGSNFTFATGSRVTVRYTLSPGYRDAVTGLRICANVPR